MCFCIVVWLILYDVVLFNPFVCFVNIKPKFYNSFVHFCCVVFDIQSSSSISFCEIEDHTVLHLSCWCSRNEKNSTLLLFLNILKRTFGIKKHSSHPYKLLDNFIFWFMFSLFLSSLRFPM